MTYITAMRGYSGSGKSTIAREYVGNHIVSRDSIRAMLTGRTDKFVGDSDFEKTVTKVQLETVRSLVRNGHNVIIDDTNLNGSYLRKWRDQAACWGVDFAVCDVRTPLDECIRRDAARPNGVGRKVIEKQAKRFPMDKWPRVVPLSPLKPYVPGTTKAITVDIDGTLAHMNGRSPYDPTRYHEDTVDRALLTITDVLDYTGYVVILLSGRSEDHRAATEAWLRDKGVIYDQLFMRYKGDNRHDGIVKSELVDKHISGVYDVIAHFDDRDRVVDAMRTKGMKVLQVGYGDF